MANMLKWSKQEQEVLLVFLLIFLVGIAGRAWLKGHPARPAQEPARFGAAN